MPSIITDDMVKEMCKMSRPIPIQAIGVLDPNKKVGTKPNFIRKKGRTGIKPVELPIYAPANINGLVQSICNITKLEPEVVENYLDNAISQEISVYAAVLNEEDNIVPIFDGGAEPTYQDFPAPVEEEMVNPVEVEYEEEKDAETEGSSGGGGGGETKRRKPRSDIGIPRGEQARTKEKRLMAAEDPNPRLRGSSRRADEDPEL
mgnify:CR=1 FL=1